MLEQPVCGLIRRCKLMYIGGGTASPTTVTTCAALTAAVQSDSPAVVVVDGIILNCGVIDIKSNKTIRGVAHYRLES